MNEQPDPHSTSTLSEFVDDLKAKAPETDTTELKRYRAHLAFWAVRVRNPIRQRKKAFCRTMTYVRTCQPKGGGEPVVVSRRLGLTGRQWVMRRKEINKLMRERQRMEQPQ